MSDWEPRRLPPSNNQWETNDVLQIMLRENPARIHPDDLRNLQQALQSGAFETTHTPHQDELRGFQNAPSTIALGGEPSADFTPAEGGLLGSSNAPDLQQGVVDFVRHFLPGSEFDPDSASPAFDLGMLLLDLMAKILAFPGGAMLVHSIMTSLGREVPELGATLNQQSDLELFEELDRRLGGLFLALLDMFSTAPRISPTATQQVVYWIHAVADSYRALEASGAFDRPDFLSFLFQYASDHMRDPLFPGQIPGLTGLVFYFLSLIYAGENPEISIRLSEGAESLLTAYETVDLASELELLRNVNAFDDIFRLLEELPTAQIDALLTIKDGVEGGIDYVESFSGLLDPALNPHLAGNQVWPRRLELMFTGIKGILNTGISIISLAGSEALLAFGAPLAAGVFICVVLIWVIDNWDWISAGLMAWEDNWNMLTQVILPYRFYRGWRWFDDNIGRPLRENVIEPIGSWVENTWNAIAGWAHNLAGD